MRKFYYCRIFILVGIVMVLSSCGKKIVFSKKRPPDFSSAILNFPENKKERFVEYPNGEQHTICTIEEKYPAESVIAKISNHLRDEGWSPLPESFLNPGIPSSLTRGWDKYTDGRKKVAQNVFQWSTDWINKDRDVVTYFLVYQEPLLGKFDPDTLNGPTTNDLEVAGIFVPAKIAIEDRARAMKWAEESKSKGKGE